MSPSQISFEEDSVFRTILHLNIYACLKAEITVKPLITNTSEEFINCCLDNFSMSFILYYVNFSICENKEIAMNMRKQF